MSDHDYLSYPRSEFAQIIQHITHKVVPVRVYAFATLNAILFYIPYILAFRAEMLQAYEFWYVLVFPIRAFRILRGLKIVKYVQHMLAGGRYVHLWTYNAKMPCLVVLIKCETEPFVTFLLRTCDQCATRTAKFTKFTCAILLTSRLLFVFIEACMTPKVVCCIGHMEF
jgi:hypothetical protein